MNAKHYLAFGIFAGLAILVTLLMAVRGKDRIHTVSQKPVTPINLSAERFENVLFDRENKPSPELLEFLRIVELKHNGTIADIVEVTQKNLLRPAHQERWQIENRYADKKDKLLPVLKELHLLDALYPKNKHYDYAFLLGGLAQTVEKRLKFLIDQWNAGVRFKKIVILTGQRELNSDEISFLHSLLEKNRRVPTSEVDMMRLLYATAELPVNMAKVPLFIINASAKPGEKRATTADTIAAWVATAPESGSILSISSQPFVGYQHSVLKTYLPSIFSLDTVGPHDADRTTITVLLDNTARWLYQELQRRTALKKA